MGIAFEDPWNQKIYVEWTAALHDILGEGMYVHYDLYQATHAHRIEHNDGLASGPCSAWPSPPYRAPMWPLVADTVKARRFLEIGCGLGYTASLMARAGGPECQVDTIEIDPSHADLAERALSRKGVADRVRILRGDAKDILPALTEPYDVIFADGGEDGMEMHLNRLTCYGGVQIDKGVLRDGVEEIVEVLKRSADTSGEEARPAQSTAEGLYRQAVKKAMIVGRDVQP
jgi:protein-L-isoaspartate O-methyltransferase